MVENTKEKIKSIILELENKSQLFTFDDVLEKARDEGIPEAETKSAFNELIEDNYIHEVRGSEGLYARTIWRDYSPSFEEIPQW